MNIDVFAYLSLLEKRSISLLHQAFIEGTASESLVTGKVLGIKEGFKIFLLNEHINWTIIALNVYTFQRFK